MKMKIFLGVLFIFILSQFNDIRANDIDQAKPTVLRKYNGEFFSETSPNRYERHQPRRERSCSSCGIVNRKKEIRTAIIRGDDVTPPYKYPWMVALYTKGNKTCTGAIISEYYILTAAHCLVKDDHKHRAFEPPKAKLEFFSPEDMGVAFLTSTYKIKAGPHVQEVIPHKLFTMSKMSYDIGLLKLKKKIICDTFKLPICLPPPRLSLPQNAVQTISGWGSTTGRVEDVNYVLQEATVKEEKFEECRGPDYMKGKYYCLKGLKNQAACYGDSGGPAFYKNKGRVYVIGVASFGQCLPGRSFFYTSVSAHLKWIYENIGSSFTNDTG